MREHRYMAENLGRKTYLKGTFTGRFIGRLDPYNSDAKHERFFDIEVTEGEIVARQDQVSNWQSGEAPAEFETESTLQVKLPGSIAVTLQCTDGSVKHFKINLKEIRLLRCGLTNKVYQGDNMYGIIRGEVSAYVLHRDTIINEIPENKKTEETVDPPPEIIGPGGTSVTSSTTRLNYWPLFFFPALVLLAATLLVSNSWFPIVTSFLLGGLLVFWQYKKGVFGARKRKLAAILLYCVLFATGLGWLLSHAIGIRKMTNEEISQLKQIGEGFLKERKYAQAVDVFNSLALQQEAYGNSLITQTFQQAVKDLKPALADGDSTATRLHNIINPVKKKQVGTLIRCWDGTISESKHRQGTCSHHGGVKDWEEPVYEEYREYN